MLDLKVQSKNIFYTFDYHCRATVLSTNDTFFTNIASGFLVHYSNKKDQSKAEICPLREFLKESRSSGTGIHVLPVWHLLLLLLLGFSEH